MSSLAPLLHFDDTNLNVINLSNKPVSEVITEAQNLVNAWHFSLKASGGDLKLEKCFWILQEHVWNNDKCTLSKHTPYQIMDTIDENTHPLQLIFPS